MASGLTFSLGAGGSSKSKVPPPAPISANGVKRNHASLNDESDDEDAARKEEVTHFGSTGAFNVSKPKVEKQALIIKPQANRDWKDASKANKRAKYGMPSRDQKKDAATREAQIKAIEDSVKPTYGLNTFEKKQTDEGMVEDDHETATEPETQAQTLVPPKQKTDDERAMDALLGKKADSTLTIAAAATEEEAFERDYKTAPDMATLDEYKAVPVEEFGAALLRGMGWKEGQGIGNQRGKKLEKAKIPERRPALLGIGAKPDAAVAEEMGAWGRGSKGGARRQEPLVYNPIVMRNKATGEELTEEELKEKLKEQKYDDLDKEAAYERKQKERERDREKDKDRRKRYDDNSDEEHEHRRRERRRERDREDEGRSSRRDGSRTRDKDRDRRRDREYDDRRDKDRRRDRDDRDRHRSRRDHNYDDRDRDSRRHRR